MVCLLLLRITAPIDYRLACSAATASFLQHRRRIAPDPTASRRSDRAVYGLEGLDRADGSARPRGGPRKSLTDSRKGSAEASSFEGTGSSNSTPSANESL